MGKKRRDLSGVVFTGEQITSASSIKPVKHNMDPQKECLVLFERVMEKKFEFSPSVWPEITCKPVKKSKIKLFRKRNRKKNQK